MNEDEARQLLALDETASGMGLKSAYRQAIKSWHPDLFDPGSTSHAEAIGKTQRINEAYRLLGGRGEGPDGPAFDPYHRPWWTEEEGRRRSRIEAVVASGALVLIVIVVIAAIYVELIR